MYTPRRRICNDVRRIFERHGVDYDQFCDHGIDADELRKIKHPAVETVIANAERENG